jgi:hypothetical protein
MPRAAKTEEFQMANETIESAVMSRAMLSKEAVLRAPDLAAAVRRFPFTPPAAGPAPVNSPPAVPTAPPSNPLEDLPFPSPGDRIKADDFKKLSQSLRVISDAFALSGALFGRSFGEAKQLLAAQQYVIASVMSVFGSEVDDLSDSALDTRKVIQIVPIKLGERAVAVVLTEAVETRRFAPNLLGLSYREASERLRATLGDITYPVSSMPASQLVGLTLAEAKQNSPK